MCTLYTVHLHIHTVPSPEILSHLGVSGCVLRRGCWLGEVRFVRLVVWSMGFSCELLCCVDAQRVVRSGTRRLLTARWAAGTCPRMEQLLAASPGRCRHIHRKEGHPHTTLFVG